MPGFLAVGQTVVIRKYGGWYRGVVSYSGAHGAARVRFTNVTGVTRQARFSSRDVTERFGIATLDEWRASGGTLAEIRVSG